MSESVFEDCTSAASALPPFERDANQWLNAGSAIAHWWSTDAGELRSAAQQLLALAIQRDPQTRPQVFAAGDFLPLLQKLNILLTASQSEEPLAHAHADQIWVLERADLMSADHVDILRRICLHYPELRIRLALFSQAQQAPTAPEGVWVSQVLNKLHPKVAAAHEPGFARTLAGPRRVWMAAGLIGVGAALAAVVLWPFARVTTAPQPVADKLSTPAVPPQGEALSPAAAPSADVSAPAAAPAQAASVPARTISASRRWLLGLPADSLVVIHAQVSTLREAELFKADRPMLVNARILLTEARAQRPPRYLVVTGPFRTPERARNYVQRLTWKANASSLSREELLTQVPR